MGFFVLSSFLLTYRLLVEFNKKSNLLKDSLLIVIQYAVRRFFRIYVVYFLFCLAVHYGPYYIGGYFHYYYGSFYAPFLSMVTLQSSGYNHLWTIAPEIKYYFIIPFISWSIIKSGKYWKLIWVSTFVFMILNETYLNVFRLTANDFILENAYYFTPRLAIFYAGSLVAIAYFKLEKSQHMESIRTNLKIQSSINIVLLFMFVYGMRSFSEFWQTNNNTNEKSLLESFNSADYLNKGFYWALFVFLMLIGSPNLMTNFFTNSKFLKICGKFSFGIYLLHPMCMTIQKDYIVTKSVIEQIIICVFFTVLVGYLFFIFIENQLMLLANRLCKLIESLKFFTKEPTTII